ncbi:mycothiol synthase [Gordonia sp. (in: high G+C Gram-positive bacteria)]|uniref:mycothiol synthase n=1 Tax=Gordonia sp. (in: high G+C Gram-positive bacteria) TaxID=84139 RepID=UPI001697AE5C|nr:mycothiol synthase [Gordonia sp. (in: high G+C Gram-positive bacteria)]NLG46151.1 mycothiol synthase [Gordonia sp. (in: high G+C Gram-positive bacteria)]
MTEQKQPRVISGPLSTDDIAVARRLVERAERVDGVPPLAEQARLAIESGADLHLRSEHGYANVIAARDGGAAMVEAVVDPDHRGRGEGRALVDAALTAAQAVPGTEPPQVWAHGDLPAAAAVATALGLERARELLQLRRPVAAPLPDLPQRDDVVVRTYAGPADDAEILRVNNDAFSWHPEQGGWTPAEIADRTGADWFDPAGVFLAFDAADPDTLLGFHWTKIHPATDDAPPLGEVYIVGVDSAAQGRGLGALLTLAGLHYMAALTPGGPGRDEAGLDEVELYVEGDNTAALNTYSKLGFTRYTADIAYRRQ